MFITVVVDTKDKFTFGFVTTEINLPKVLLTPAIDLLPLSLISVIDSSPVSTTPVVREGICG